MYVTSAIFSYVCVRPLCVCLPVSSRLPDWALQKLWLTLVPQPRSGLQGFWENQLCQQGEEIQVRDKTALTQTYSLNISLLFIPCLSIYFIPSPSHPFSNHLFLISSSQQLYQAEPYSLFIPQLTTTSHKANVKHSVKHWYLEAALEYTQDIQPHTHRAPWLFDVGFPTLTHPIVTTPQAAGVHRCHGNAWLLKGCRNPQKQRSHWRPFGV